MLAACRLTAAQLQLADATPATSGEPAQIHRFDDHSDVSWRECEQAVAQGSGEIRQPGHLLPTSVSSSSASQAQPALSGSLSGATLQQPVTHQRSHRQRRQKLPRLVADASNGGQTLQAEPAQVLRRRSSFIKASRPEELQALQAAELHGKCVSKGLVDVLPVLDNQQGSATCSVSRAMDPMPHSKHGSNRETSESLSDITLFVKRSRTPDSPEAALAEASEHHTSYTSQHHMGCSIKRAEVLQAKKVKNPNMLMTYEALRQSIAQVNACTHELQEEQKELKSMQRVFQVMNAQVGALLNEPVSAVRQELQSRLN